MACGRRRSNKNFILATQGCMNNCNQSCNQCGCNVCKCCQSFKDILCGLINESIEVTTSFGVIDGVLLAVENDYIVLLENNGDQVLIQTSKIESVSPLT